MGIYTGGFYSGITYHTFAIPNDVLTPAQPDPDTGLQVSFIDDYIIGLIDQNGIDSIVSIFMVPAAFVDAVPNIGSGYPLRENTARPVSVNVTVSRQVGLDGYSPRNKKLLTYPYHFLCVDTLDQSKNYRYELFYGSVAFQMSCAINPNPDITIAPVGYNGYGNNGSTTDPNYTEAVTISGMPQCAYAIDSYRAWLAQKATGEVLGLAAQAGAAAGSFAMGNIPGGVLGIVGAANTVNSMVIEATQGAKPRGTQSGTTQVAMRAKQPYFKHMCVTAQYAAMIDDYFDRFGYACCRIKVPNRNVRVSWTYTKTKNCTISGDIPADDMEKIRSIYDNGITFWRSPLDVGNYSKNNSVMT